MALRMSISRVPCKSSSCRSMACSPSPSRNVDHGLLDCQGERRNWNIGETCLSSGTVRAFLGDSSCPSTEELSNLSGRNVGSRLRISTVNGKYFRVPFRHILLLQFHSGLTFVTCSLCLFGLPFYETSDFMNVEGSPMKRFCVGFGLLCFLICRSSAQTNDSPD